MIRCTILAGLCALAFTLPAQDQTQPVPVRVMSFNIRNDSPGDGDNRWAKRQDVVLHTIRSFNPDLLGMQKVLAAQGDDLQKALPGYGFAGTGRDDGKRGGEFNPIMFKKDRFD